MVNVVTNRRPWVYRRFLKDKLFTRERYWRHMSSSTDMLSSIQQPPENDDDDDGVVIFLPDALVWRRYLKFLSSLCVSEAYRRLFRLVLLESVVELMDWRNSSLQDGEGCRPETAAFQERNRMRQLLQDNHIAGFCDLSVRDDDDDDEGGEGKEATFSLSSMDEFDLLQYAQMPIPQRSHHALLRAARMLQTHSNNNNNNKKTTPRSVCVVVSDDNHDAYLSHAEEGVQVIPVSGFLESLVERGLVAPEDCPQLQETMERSSNEYERRNAPSAKQKTNESAKEHWSEETVRQGLKEGSLLRGRLEVTKENPREAFVTTTKGRYFVNQELGHFNRCLHHDAVILQRLPESEWGFPVGKKRLVFYTGNDEDDIGGDNPNLGTPIPSARVVALAQPARRRFVATMVDTPSTEERNIVVVPMDTRIPKIRIQTRSWQHYVNQRLLVQIDEWGIDSNYPNGHCVTILGPVGDLESEILSLLEEHEINLVPFSASALALLPDEGAKWQVPEHDALQRRDLRKTHRIFSVDPPGCQDIDDTMHAKVLTNGDVEVGVHIADVTHFVPHNSPLDKEAQVRGTTFYLVDRRYDMLPSLLSSNLCSLHGDTDRLAVSVIWTLSPDFAEIKSCWFGRTVIRNCQAMTYDQAHNILHGLPPDETGKPIPPPLTAGYPVKPQQIKPLRHDLDILTRLARKLRRDREEMGGAVDLSSGDVGSELKFVLDQNGNPTKVSSKKELEIHHTIAEMMIFANQTVAERIYGSFPDSSLLRIHRTVEEDRFEDLQSALKAGGIAFDGTSNAALAKSLKDAKQGGKEGAVVNSLWQSLATRAMSEALYVCTGRQNKGTGLAHYGLGIEKYTHFTSPIRRYADVVVHKQLLASLENEAKERLSSPPPGFSPRKILQSVPGSSAISIMSGEGLKSDGEGERNSELSSMEIVNEGIQSLSLGTSDVKQSRIVPYGTEEVDKICGNLNQQNRMAKLSSMECQRLFLSLYFRDNTETTKAVVTDLRTNGVFAYVPKFDLRAPVYLSDRDGNVQLDPGLLDLPADAGLDATLGFAKAGNCRRFPSATCSIVGNEDQSLLQVRVPEAKHPLNFRVLDVVTVHISCDLSDVKARIPPPRLHLIADALASTKQRSGTHGSTRVTSQLLSGNLRGEESKQGFPEESTWSLYQQIQRIDWGSSVPLRSGSTGSRAFVSVIPGRKVFANYVNPDTRAAIQDAAISAASDAAALRRAAVQASSARRNEFESSRNIERSATIRTQKLAAAKRNTRKSKGR